jgi:hypothetical protein
MKSKIYIADSKILEIVADGAIASHHTADGRLIPVLIVNNSNNDDLNNLIKIHEDTPPGDAESMWAKMRFNSKVIYLVVKFKKPLEVEMSVEFNLSQHNILVDGIVHSKGVYLQPGNNGDNVSDNINAPKILVEIPAGSTIVNWDKTLKKILVKKLIEKGFTKKEALVASTEHIARRRELWGARL